MKSGRRRGKHTLSSATAPTELASVERMILHYGPALAPATAPTELASVER